MVTDRFAMAHSVEARVPFLDREMIDLVFTIPAEVRTRAEDPKYLLKAAIGDLLPVELLSAPKKGFVLPLPLWTRKELRPMIGDLLGPSALKSQGFFLPTLWTKIVEPHLRGDRDFTAQVWTLLMFQLWHDQWQRHGMAAAYRPRAIAG
jgi:asparagine synthase (glutamine-hydrolysing)